MYSMLPYVTGIRYHATFSNSFLFVFLLLFVFCFCVCVFCLFVFVFGFFFGGVLCWLVGWLVLGIFVNVSGTMINLVLKNETEWSTISASPSFISYCGQTTGNPFRVSL